MRGTHTQQPSSQPSSSGHSTQTSHANIFLLKVYNFGSTPASSELSRASPGFQLHSHQLTHYHHLHPDCLQFHHLHHRHLTTLEVADTNEDRDMTEADLKTKAMLWS